MQKNKINQETIINHKFYSKKGIKYIKLINKINKSSNKLMILIRIRFKNKIILQKK